MFLFDCFLLSFLPSKKKLQAKTSSYIHYSKCIVWSINHIACLPRITICIPRSLVEFGALLKNASIRLYFSFIKVWIFGVFHVCVHMYVLWTYLFSNLLLSRQILIRLSWFFQHFDRRTRALISDNGWAEAQQKYVRMFCKILWKIINISSQKICKVYINVFRKSVSYDNICIQISSVIYL